MKKNQKGFSAASILLVIVIVGVIGVVGWKVMDSRKSKTTDTSVATNNKPADQTSETSQPPSPETYCDAIEKACIDLDGNWKKTFESATDPDTGKERKRLELSSDKYPTVKVRFSPYVWGVGGGCSEGTIVQSDDVAKAPSQKLVADYSYFQEVRDSKPVGAPKYSPSLSVQSSKSPKSVTVGKTDCLGLGLYDNKNYGDKGVHGSLTAGPDKSFASEKEAQDWLNSADAAAARKILLSLNLK